MALRDARTRVEPKRSERNAIGVKPKREGGVCGRKRRKGAGQYWVRIVSGNQVELQDAARRILGSALPRVPSYVCTFD